MKYNRREYILAWIAIGFLVVSATILLINSATNSGNRQLQIILSFISWVITISSGGILFLNASNWAIMKKLEAEKFDEDVKVKHKEKSIPLRNEKEQFDIQSVAKKIVRRVSPDREPEVWGKQLLNYLVSEIEIMSGIIYFKNAENIFKSVSTYAYPLLKEPYSFSEGEGLPGQTAKNRQVTILRSIPDDYTEVFSGLGKGKPSYLAMVPLVIDDHCLAVIELAGFRWADENLEQLLQIISRELAQKIKDHALDSKEALSGKSPSTKSGEDEK